jgi:ABC-type branched-subunit amino acid transport system substrate-binding protein
VTQEVETVPVPEARPSPEPAPPPVAMTVPEAVPPVPVPPETVPDERKMLREEEERLKYQEALRIFREEGNPDDAFQMIEAFLRMHPESTYADDAMLEQSRIWSYRGETKKALSSMENLLIKYPSSPLRKQVFIEMMLIHRDIGKWKDCVEASRSGLSLDPLPDEKSQLLVVGGTCKAQRRDRREAVADMILGYRAAGSDTAREEALDTLQLTAGELKDRELESLLGDSDGFEPFGTLAVELLERQIEKGYYTESMAGLMDLMIHYPESLPEERIQDTFNLLRDHLFVRSNTIGTVLPLSGRYAVFGQKALQGIQTVFGFQTSGPGGSGEFSLVVKDSGADPVQAAQVVRDLAETEQVIAIIGPIFSRTTHAAAQAAEESGIPLISLSPDPLIPDLGRNIFRRSLVDKQQISALVRLVHDRLMMTRFAFLYPDNSYGREMMNLFWDELDQRGAEVIAAENFPAGQTDFGPQIRAMVGLNRKMTPEELALKESGVDVELQPIIDFDALFIPADFQTVGLLAPQLAFYDVTEVLLIGADGWNSPWLVELGEHYVEGALFTGGYHPDISDAFKREMIEKYWLTFGEDPQPIAVQAYDAASLVKYGVESGQARDRSSMREFLLRLKDQPSAEGPLTTDERGDIVQRPLLLTVVDGEIVPFQVEFD